MIEMIQIIDFIFWLFANVLSKSLIGNDEGSLRKSLRWFWSVKLSVFFVFEKRRILIFISRFLWIFFGKISVKRKDGHLWEKIILTRNVKLRFNRVYYFFSPSWSNLGLKRILTMPGLELGPSQSFSIRQFPLDSSVSNFLALRFK